MKVIEKMFAGMNTEITKTGDSEYYVKLNSNDITVEGTLKMSSKEMIYNIEKIQNKSSKYIITRPLHKRPLSESVFLVGDVLVVTNLSVENPSKKVYHTTNYRINLEYLFTIPVRSLVTQNRSVYLSTSFFRIVSEPAYITLETKTEKYIGTMLYDVEKSIHMYSIKDRTPHLEYHDKITPIEIDTNISATIEGKGIASKLITAVKQKIYKLFK